MWVLRGSGCSWSLICFPSLCSNFAACYLGSARPPTAWPLVWHGNASTRPVLAELPACDFLGLRNLSWCCSLPALSLPSALRSLGPESTAKLVFLMLLPCWCHIHSLPWQLVKALRTRVQSGEKRSLFLSFPPRTVCARDTENQIPQIWGLCQLSLQADRGSCCRSTFSNCYFISICFLAS